METETICAFRLCSLEEANELLVQWEHRMGPLKRGNQSAKCHILESDSQPLSVVTASHLIRSRVGGVSLSLTRDNTIELSRLCSATHGLNRVCLRLWRELVFPKLNFRYAISYQDSKMHKGNLYRFDGWKRVGFSHSGKDTRSGRPGRDKFVWLWETPQKYGAVDEDRLGS